MRATPRTRSTSSPFRAAALIAVAAMCATGARAAGVEAYEGEAYSANGERLLYRESHWLFDEEGGSTRVVLYRCANGQPFARKHVHASASAQAPDFELTDARSGYREGVRSAASGRSVFVRSGGDVAQRSAALELGDAAVVDAGFDAFVRTHWGALADGRALPIEFVVPSRLAALSFSVRRVGDDTEDGRLLRTFRLALASWYGRWLPHVDVAYDVSSRTLRRYRGISNLRDAQGRNLDVRIEFPPAARTDAATQADVDAALRAPLVAACDRD